METRWDATRSREFPARAEEEEGVGASLMSRTGNRGMRSAGPRARERESADDDVPSHPF